jgi:hypothetical protein
VKRRKNELAQALSRKPKPEKSQSAYRSEIPDLDYAGVTPLGGESPLEIHPHPNPFTGEGAAL